MNEKIDYLSKSYEKANAYFTKKDNAPFKTVDLLQKMNDKLEAEHNSRIAAEKQANKLHKTDRIFTIITIIIGLLTLAATIFGILAL